MTDIEITEVIDHDDGSATMSFDLSEEATKTMASYGVKFLLYCTAYGITTDEAFDLIAGRK